jgi:uncharacterized protein (DUF1800 family)
VKLGLTVGSWWSAHRGAMDDRALVAHLLRRCGFGPHPGQVEALTTKGVPGAIAAVLSAAPLAPAAAEFGTDDDYGVLRAWWLEVMSRPDAGLHEKMVWFWHGHLTSSIDKSLVQLMWRQHQLLRKHALGNFREMVQAITVDAAMLHWLDGDGSTAEAPNENYGRELMELFTLGRDGGYTEADVRAAAYALSGWSIDSGRGNEVVFDAAKGPTHPVTLLGKQVSKAADVVTVVCDHPTCAPFVVGRIHRFLAGVDPSDERRAELASTFRSSGLEIRPVVEAIISHPSFMEARLNRPRFPIEWFIAAQAVMGSSFDDNVLELLGQVPFSPPNVAGWPVGNRWLSAGATFTRAQAAWDHAGDTEVVDTQDPVTTIMEKAGLFELSAETRAAMDGASRGVEQRRERASVLHALAICCPEFALA